MFSWNVEFLVFRVKYQKLGLCFIGFACRGVG